MNSRILVLIAVLGLLVPAQLAAQSSTSDTVAARGAAPGADQVADSALQIGSAIYGRAFLAVDETPLAGAVIYIEGSALTAVTNAEGAFMFESLLPGMYRLTMYHSDLADLGWSEPPMQLVLVPAAAELDVDFALSSGGVMVEVGGPGSDSEPYQLDPIMVMGRRTVFERVEREGARVDAVGRSEIEPREASAHHVGDLIRGFASLRVSEPHAGAVCVESRRRTTNTSATALGGRTNVSVIESYRRVERSCPKMVQVYIDGVRAPLAEYLISGLRPQDVERIEYVNGVAAGARFGTGSAEGILLIYTRMPGSR